MENVGVIHIPHIEDGLVESSNSSRKEINVRRTGTRAKNYKKLKHKNETSKSTRDFSLFRVEGTNALSVKMTTQTTIKSSSELGDSTNSVHSKTQIQPSATTTEASRWERENNEDTETTLEPALAYDDNYYQETLASQFRDGPFVGGVALSEPSYNFSGLQITSLNETPRVWSSHQEFIAQVGLKLYMFIPAVVLGVLLAVFLWSLAMLALRTFGLIKSKLLSDKSSDLEMSPSHASPPSKPSHHSVEISQKVSYTAPECSPGLPAPPGPAGPAGPAGRLANSSFTSQLSSSHSSPVSLSSGIGVSERESESSDWDCGERDKNRQDKRQDQRTR